MLQDWIAREGWIVVNYWLMLTALGLTVLPLAFSLLPSLPDRGYTLARPLGLLLVAFVFWLLGVLGFLDNSRESILIAWLVVLGISIVAYQQSDKFDLRAWLREHRAIVIATEVLFIVLLVSFAVFRSHMNELRSTEKPMDLAFMSAVQQSETFPPNDPWLSGYSISYYYFGYVMGAMNAKVVDIPSTTAFSMHLATLFALSGTAVMGIVYNMIQYRALHKRQPEGDPLDEDTQPPDEVIVPPRQTGWSAVGFGLLAMVFLLLMSNFHTLFVGIPYQNRWFDDSYYQFWDAKNLEALPRDEGGEIIAPIDILQADEVSRSTWWWFDAARVITEHSIVPGQTPGNYVDAPRINEVIDEFPAFSFILGDSHPHVMGIPFVLLAIGLALNLIFTQQRQPTVAQFALYGVCVGALVFLNTWDAPIYIVVFGIVELVRRIGLERRFTFDAILHALAMIGILTVIMVVAYFPFLTGFRSQLSGVLPNVMHPTRPQQLFLVFGPFLILFIVYLGVEIWRGSRLKMMNWTYSAVLVLLLVVMLGFFTVTLVSFGVYGLDYSGVIQAFTSDTGVINWSTITDHLLARRLVALPGLLVIALMLMVVAARLFPLRDWRQSEAPYRSATGLTLVLIGAGVGLVLIPEFVYLRDNFSHRMNTVFKFYYQAWIMFSIAAAYGVYSIVADIRERRVDLSIRLVYSVMVVAVVGVGLIYVIGAVYTRAYAETGIWNLPEGTQANLTMDGGAGFTYGEDYAAIMCLQDLVGDGTAVVAEAKSRGSYDPNSARVGSLTGLPIVVGWEWHQQQWRGEGWVSAIGSRPEDMDFLYTSEQIGSVQTIVERYGIDYIFYGRVERNEYGDDGERKFQEFYEIVCEETQFGTARVYAVERP